MENNIKEHSGSSLDAELGSNSASKNVKFDYSQLDGETATFLKEKEQQMNSIADRTRFDMGKQLSEAQTKLANNYRGTFEKWYTSLGMNRTTVYFWIGCYKFSNALEDSTQMKNFGKAPRRLKQDILKQNASEEAKQAVLNGNIKTHKEYKALEAKIKQREQELSAKDAQIADQQAELEENRKTQVELTNQLRKASNSQPAPKVITKTVTKEVQVEPDDYEQLKQEKKQLEEKFSKAAGELDKVTNRLKDYEDAEHQEHRANHWKNRGRVSVYKLRSNIHNFLITNEIGSEDREAALDSGKEALESLDKALDDLQSWIDDKRSITGGRRTVNTLEGEIIK